MDKFFEELRRDLRAEAKRMCGGPGLDSDRIYRDNRLCIKALAAVVRDVWTPAGPRARAASALAILGQQEAARIAEGERQAALVRLAGLKAQRPRQGDSENVFLRALRDYGRQQRREEETRRMVARTLRQAMRRRG